MLVRRAADAMARSDVRRLVKIVLVVLAGALALSGCATHATSAAGRTGNEWGVQQRDVRSGRGDVVDLDAVARNAYMQPRDKAIEA